MPDANDPGLLAPSETGLLIDQYELAMASSYHRRGMNQEAIFELFARRLPPHRTWLLAAGLGPTLRLVRELRFSDPELAYLGSIGFADDFLEYLSDSGSPATSTRSPRARCASPTSRCCG